MTANPAPGAASRPALRFDRHELAGAFGDIGTDLPLLIGMTVAAGLDGTSVLVLFGALQILTGLAYRMPMPVQPLKAMAAIVIAGGASAATLRGGGVAIGVVMLLLAATGLLDVLARVVPRPVVRGIQLGLGLQLAGIALGRFVPADGPAGFVLAAAAFALIATLLGNRRVPAALPVVALGSGYALLTGWDDGVRAALGVHLPAFHPLTAADIATGFVALALPQLPLSLANSVLATRQVALDLFPDRPLSIRRIGLSYAALNLVAPWFGGVPTCHGSGGIAGHFAFGGRTGGSVVIYGALLAATGLVLGPGFGELAGAFPRPLLGVILLFESLALIWLVRDTAADRDAFPIVALVGLCASGLPYGYAVGLVLGTLLHHLRGHARLVSPDAR